VVHEPGCKPAVTHDPAAAARQVLTSTRRALETLEGSWDEAQVRSWTEHLAQRQGRLVLTGIGKSGIIAQKIAATLASTGCPSFFLHPVDALHGDLGMVTAQDSVLILSNSGETEEIVKLIPNLARIGVSLAAITSRPTSRLGQAATWCFSYSLPEGEGCPLNFAPMASTTLQLIWGDLLAAFLMVRIGFTLESFARLHPAGNLGSRLLKAQDLMHTDFPRVAPEASLLEGLAAMTQGKLGMTTVMTGDQLQGIISDGDIRRALERAQASHTNPLELKVADIMSANPITLAPGTLAVEAASLLEARKITFVVILEGGSPLGILHIHDLLAAKVI